MIHWWVYIPMAIFLAFSAATWLIIKRAEPGSPGAYSTPPARDAVTVGAGEPAASQRELAGVR